MTIFSGQTRISEEEDLWRVIGIREVTDSTINDRQQINGYLISDDFYRVLDTEYPIYYDLERNKYRYKDNNDYPDCEIIEGYYTRGNFYETVILGENHVIYYDEDRDEYYIYEQNSYKRIYPYSESNLYYYDSSFYGDKTDIGSDSISILNGNNEYEEHPYIQGLLRYNIFYSDEIIFADEENIENKIYYNKNDELYYIYDIETETLITPPYQEEIRPNSYNSVICFRPDSDVPDIKILVEGYKIGDRFFTTISAGYENPIIPDGNNDITNIYYDQINHKYYDLNAQQIVEMPHYDQLEIVGNVLYFHNYDTEDDIDEVYHRTIINGYFVNGVFYRDKIPGDPTAIYHTVGTDNFWKYYVEYDAFRPYPMTNSYQIGVLYSNKVDPSSDYFYKDENNDVYYYDGNYHITTQTNSYYIPIVDKMCLNKRTEFVEDNHDLYHSNDGYYIYQLQGSSLFSVDPVSCYFKNDVPCYKEKPAIGAIYYDIENDEYYTYKNSMFEEYDNTPIISDENQIVLSLSKADLLIDDDTLDGDPIYDEDVVLTGPTSQRAGIFTSDLYNRFIDLENRYKLRISSTTYNTLADLENDAPTDTNCIYIVGTNKQYVLSDDGTYIQIGNTDLSGLDLENVASVNDINVLVDDVSDILETIQKQDSNLQNQIDSKYSTANIIRDLNGLSNHQNDAVSGQVMIDYITALLANSVIVSEENTETVVTSVEKYEDSLKVHYKTIATASIPKYVNSLDNGSPDRVLIDSNHALSAALAKSLYDDIIDQINVITGYGLVFGWASHDLSDTRIDVIINSRVV